MHHRLLGMVALLVYHVIGAQAQTTFTLSGYIEDAKSGEKLISATIYDQRSGNATLSNTYGFFSLTLPADSVQLVASYVGYVPETMPLRLEKDRLLSIKLQPEVTLATVEVVGTRLERIEERSQMSQVDIPVAQIKKTPALLGEVDVLKTLQLLPGVQSGGEGQNGLYVRGGSPDQNLILLDGVPVYNVSHVLGFFSVFNADAIKNVTLTKGGFPARYGGRLSSVIEINMKEGNTQEFHGEGSVGLIASRLTLEGPIQKDKTSFIISGRRTYVDLIARPLIKSANTAKQSFNPVFYFYDLNAKVNHKFNERHRLFLSGYFGKDIFGSNTNENYDNGTSYKSDNGTNWGNATTALRWNYLINSKLFANTTLTYSRYNFTFFVKNENSSGGQTNIFNVKYVSGIEDWAGKIDLDYVPNPRHYVRMGGGLTHHTYNPGAVQLNSQSTNVQFDTLLGSLARPRSLESALYIEDDMLFGRFKVNAGLHLSTFHVLGDTPANYHYLQPRVSVRYLLPKQTSLKASFCTMAQYINLITNEALTLPTDLWVPSTERIKPQEAWQAAVGAAKTLRDGYEVSIEAYYKDMKNVLSYREGAQFIGFNNDWQDKVTQGNGESYGLELFMQKTTGKLTGWVGYTLSWNWRQFDDINAGKRYFFKYDRRHDVEFVVSYDWTPRITVSGTWVYGTGNALTLPEYNYSRPYNPADGSSNFLVQVEAYGNKNSYRMPAYHRADISIEFKKQKRRWQRSWVISAYNLYNRRNPYYIYQDFSNDKKVFRQISLFPIIPSIAYNFKF